MLCKIWSGLVKMERELIDRPRGILTEADREYLMDSDNSEVSENNDGGDYTKRHRIRERVKHGLLDFVVLSAGLSLNDTQQIFAEIGEWVDDMEEVEELANRIGGPRPPTPDESADVMEQDHDVPLLLTAWRHAFFFYYMALSQQADGDVIRRPVEEGARSAVQALSLVYEGVYYEDIQANFSVLVDEDSAIPPEEVDELPLDPLVREPLLALLVQRGELTPEEAMDLMTAPLNGGE